MTVTVGGVTYPSQPTTFELLDEIVAILGSTKTTFWPFLETTGTVLSSYKESVHAVTQVDGGTDGFYPHRHRGGVYSLSFNSADSQMLLGEDHADFEFANVAGDDDSPFSVGAWVLPRDVTGCGVISKYREGVGNLREWDFTIDNATSVARLGIFDESTDGDEIGYGDTALVLNEWAFIVGTYNGVEEPPAIYIYLNGVVDNNGVSIETGDYAAMEQTDAKLSIGARTDAGDAAGVELDGRIALPFVCGKVLSAIEVKNLYGLGARLLGISE